MRLCFCYSGCVFSRLRQIHSVTNVKKPGDGAPGDKASGVVRSGEKATETDGDGDKSIGVTDSDIKMSVVSPIFILLGRKTIST